MAPGHQTAQCPFPALREAHDKLGSVFSVGIGCVVKLCTQGGKIGWLVSDVEAYAAQ